MILWCLAKVQGPRCGRQGSPRFKVPFRCEHWRCSARTLTSAPGADDGDGGLIDALLGGAAALSLGGAFAFLGHVLAGTIWAIFHILIVLLQGFIFMMLTLIYIGQAPQGH